MDEYFRFVGEHVPFISRKYREGRRTNAHSLPDSSEKANALEKLEHKSRTVSFAEDEDKSYKKEKTVSFAEDDDKSNFIDSKGFQVSSSAEPAPPPPPPLPPPPPPLTLEVPLSPHFRDLVSPRSMRRTNSTPARMSHGAASEALDDLFSLYVPSKTPNPNMVEDVTKSGNKTPRSAYFEAFF